MEWTVRMAEVKAFCAGREGKPSWAELGRALGVSRERARQLYFKLERWNRTHRLPEREHEKRREARYLFMTLGLIEKRARQAACKWRPPRPPGVRREQRANYPPTWMAPPPPPPTQAELRELARHAHWAEVVYRAGTDEIIWVEPKGWRVR